MNCPKLVQQAIGAILGTVFLVGCGAPVTPDTSTVQTAAAQTLIAELTAKAQTTAPSTVAVQ